MRTHLRNGSRSGFTIVEMALAAALFAVLFGSAAMALLEGADAYKATRINSNVETRVRRAIDRVASELMSTGQETLLPDPIGQFGASDLVFQRAVGTNGDDVVWGNQIRFAFEYENGEADDGVDNNDNGLIDEGVLVMTRDDGGANEQRVVLVHGVTEFLEGETADGNDENGNGVIDEAGFNVHRVGDTLTLRLSVAGVSPQAGVIVRTLETSIRLRN